MQFAEDMGFPNPAGDKLRVLGTEIEDQDLLAVDIWHVYTLSGLTICLYIFKQGRFITVKLRIGTSAADKKDEIDLLWFVNYRIFTGMSIGE